MRKTDHNDPDIFLERVTRLAVKALGHWNLDVMGVTPIKVRENAVFSVQLTDGRKVAMRVHRQGYHSDAALRSEFAWMAALSDYGISVPTVVPSRSGQLFEHAAIAQLGGTWQVDVFEWIEGRRLGESGGTMQGGAEEVAAQYRTIGSLMARMHNQAEGWARPVGFHRHAWDTAGFTSEQPLWGRFWELAALTAEQRDLMLRIRAVIEQALTAEGQTPDRFGLIHADLVPENVMVDGTDVRIIDFDDAGLGWYLFDIATSLYFLTNDPLYPTARDALLDGYRCERALSDETIARLPIFMAARATTYLGWVHTRQGTETARELTPFLVELACATVERCLQGL
jgi:Ser/Thr protein kinase RdoA (MazF antagonist)